MHRLQPFVLCLALLGVGCSPQKAPTTVKVMSWNILHGADDLEGGPEFATQIIREIDPDVVLLIETYGSGPRIADSLGYFFHLVAAEGTSLDDPGVNLSILSKYPFGERLDTDYPFYLGGREIIIQNQPVRFFSNWFHYLPWEDEPENLGMTTDELLEWERTGAKFEMIQKVLPYLSAYAAEADSIPLVIGGDMNAPSHLDWDEQTADIHNGLVVPWYSSAVLWGLGLTDSYREIHPDPLTHPGITWDMPDVRDEHRIDYIYYKSPRLLATASETHKAPFGEPLTINGRQIPYPSDHGFVVTTFELRGPDSE
jgi:endonuclease/exonuclease/phosphatase family metal-dependent hydrolase